MASSPLRSRPASVASSFLQNTSPRLPSPLNPSPNAFLPSVQSNTSRNSPGGETIESLYSIREGDGLELTIPPKGADSQPLNIPRSRTTSFSRSRLYTQVQTEVQASSLGSFVDISPVSGSVPHSGYQVQPHRAYGRHPSPSSSPYGQGKPFPTSSPFASPLADHSRSSPLMMHSPPMIENSRPLSSYSSNQGSPVSIHIPHSQCQSSFRSSPQSSQSHFLLPGTVPPQGSPTSPPSAPSSSFPSPRQSPIQQSFSNAYEAHDNALGFSSLHDDVQYRSPHFDARPHISPQGSLQSQHVSSANSDRAALYVAYRAGVYGPGPFRDEEIRASFDEILPAWPMMDSCAPEAEKGNSLRAIPMSMGSGRSSSRIRRTSLGDQMRRDGFNEMEIGGPPPVENVLAAGVMAHCDRHVVRSRASSIRSQGSASGARPSGFVHTSDGVMSGEVTANAQEIEHATEHARERGHTRRMSNASIRSTSSRCSRMSGPAQSPSQAMLVVSQSQTQTFSSLSSLGFLEEAEREERRSKSFFCRKRVGSVADARKGDRLSPRMRDGVMSGELGDLVSSNSDRMGDAADAASPQSPKGTAKHGSLIFGSKTTTVVEQQHEGYDRAEKYVSMAVMSILSPSAIRALSPLGDVLTKAAHTAAFVGHEAAPLIKDALSVTSSILAFAPVPGLEEAAKALLNIWDSCQKVDTNRVSCLRLVERCATLLYAVRREISEAGEDVANDLAAPLAQLCTALNSVRSFLEAQIHRPLLARYVRRDEITRDLAGCNQVITDAAERFGISVQIRTLKELYAAEHESRQFVEEALQSIRMDNHFMHMQLMEYIQSHTFGQGVGTAGLPPGNALGLTTDGVVIAGPGSGQSLTMGSLMSVGGGDRSLPNTSTALTWNVSGAGDYAGSPTPTRTSFLSAETKTTTTEATVSLSHTIAGVYRAQDSKDANADVAALRSRFAAAIDTRNDVELLRGLQVEEEEVPEAAMTLGRVLGLRTRHGLDGEEHEVEPIDGFDRKIMGRVESALPNLTPIRSAPSSFVDPRSALATSNESSPADEQYETASEDLSADVRTVSVSLSESVESAGESTSARSRISNDGIHINSDQHSEFSYASGRASSRILAHAQTQDGGPLPYVDEQQVEPNNEESYRLIAGTNHAFHEYLTLPLWSPTPVKLGAVGYLDKSRGEFITLFNAFEPPRCSKADLCHVPSFYGYGKLPTYSREGGKRNAAQKSLSALSGFLTFKGRGERTFPERIARQYPFPLERGKPTAHLCVERSLHRFIEDLDIPKTWFKLQVDQIVRLFGPSHGIRKEDLIVVVGALDALDYALFVSTAYLDGRARFNVFSDRKKGEPWGMFTTERAAQNKYLASQSRWIEVGENEHAMFTFTSKVSTVRVTDAGDPLPCDGMDTVLLAGLRFELDAPEPTLM